MSQKTYMYDTQWTALINAINGGDTGAIATALGQIKTSVDGITTALGSLSTDVTQNATQWSNLVNAITNQSLTVDLSNITSDIVSNVSGVSGSSVTGALDSLGDMINPSTPQWTYINNSYVDIYLYKIGILKMIWLDTAKTNIPSGWISGGLQQLPSGYECLLSPQININDTIRTGTQVYMTVNSTGMFSINCSATVTSGTNIRLQLIYI